MLETKKISCLSLLIVAYFLSSFGISAFEFVGVSPFSFMCALFIPVFGVHILIALYIPVILFILQTAVYMADYSREMMNLVSMFVDLSDFPLSPNGLLAVLYGIAFFSRTFLFFTADKMIRKAKIRKRLKL